jgi:hypothetical protein
MSVSIWKIAKRKREGKREKGKIKQRSIQPIVDVHPLELAKTERAL